jgi:hypothetical protein
LKQEPEIKELDNDIQEENKQEKKSNQETEKAEMYPQESLDVVCLLIRKRYTILLASVSFGSHF